MWEEGVVHHGIHTIRNYKVEIHVDLNVSANSRYFSPCQHKKSIFELLFSINTCVRSIILVLLLPPQIRNAGVILVFRVLSLTTKLINNISALKIA